MSRESEDPILKKKKNQPLNLPKVFFFFKKKKIIDNLFSKSNFVFTIKKTCASHKFKRHMSFL
jgi:hypothetical protein